MNGGESVAYLVERLMEPKVYTGFSWRGFKVFPCDCDDLSKTTRHHHNKAFSPQCLSATGYVWLLNLESFPCSWSWALKTKAHSELGGSVRTLKKRPKCFNSHHNKCCPNSACSKKGRIQTSRRLLLIVYLAWGPIGVFIKHLGAIWILTILCMKVHKRHSTTFLLESF